MSIFRFPGGKSRSEASRAILSNAPDDFDEFREPFVGGGGIFFKIPTHVKRWINDINPHLMSVYKALKERPSDFILKCCSIMPPQSNEPEVYPTDNSSGKKYNARLKKHFDEMAFNTECDQALRYFFVNRTVWGGRVNYEEPSRMYFSNPNGWNIVKTRKLEYAAQKLKHTRITVGDYKQCFESPGKNTWIFADPPYYKDTHLSRQSKLYRYGFTEQDHEDFAKCAKNCKHNLLITYDDHPFIINLFKNDFHIQQVTWTYCGTSKSKKDVGKELIITNYAANI